MKRVAITGASGYVARNLIQRCVTAGLDVVGISRSVSNDSANSIVNVRDYLDGDQLYKILAGVDTVFHLAAQVHRQEPTEVKGVAEYWKANVDSVTSLAKASQKAGVRRFVFLSSVAVNGESTTVKPFRAEDLPRPAGLYG